MIGRVDIVYSLIIFLFDFDLTFELMFCKGAFWQESRR